MNPYDITWFYWPVTFSTAATLAALHLYKTAARNGKSRRNGLVLAFSGALGVAAPVIALALGVFADCHDTGHGINFRPIALGLAPVAMLAWFAAIWFLLHASGMSVVESQRLPTRIFLFILPAMLLEFFVSTISLEVYCNDDQSWMYGQILAAFLLPTALGVLLVAFMNRSHR